MTSKARSQKDSHMAHARMSQDDKDTNLMTLSHQAKEWRVEVLAESRPEPKDNHPEFDSLIAQYFGDVRQYDLLTFPEERALWRRIQHWNKRVRRALYCSPIALDTLIHISQGSDAGGMATSDVERLREAVRFLQRISDDLRRMKKPQKAAQRSPRTRGTRRGKQVRLWCDWLATWEALDLPDSFFGVLQARLADAHQDNPDEPGLHKAYRLWAGAHRKFELARADMMQANLRLVIHVANRYRNRGVPFLDIIQEGNMGLMRALDKFEPERGLKFVTYAHWWIRQAISRAVSEQYRTVRLPCHVVERKGKLHAADDRLWDQYGRAPSVRELSVELGWTPTEVEDLLAAIQPITRLEQTISADGDELVDFLPDEQAQKPEEAVAEEQLQDRLTACLEALPDREAFILRLRYGLGAAHPHTLQEIADILELSRERVRQLEKVAFEKLRQPELRALLADFARVA